MHSNIINLIGLPSALDIAEAVKNLVLEAQKKQGNFQSLVFICKEKLIDIIAAEEQFSLAKEGYSINPSTLKSYRWAVRIHHLEFDENGRCMKIKGKVVIGEFLLLNVDVYCNLLKGEGSITLSEFDKRKIG